MGRKQKLPSTHRWANPEMSKAMRDRRLSNATQPHVPRPDKGTRRVRNRQAVTDQNSNEGA
jgi:hypothetical protein